ncbi:fibronectin type III domain-containing protein, partial [Nocardioides sp. SOB44]
PVTGYTITSTPDAVSKTVPGDQTTATIGGLTNGTAYTFTVVATNAIGTSTASDPSNEVTPAGVPDTVTKPSATRGDKSATITWTKPSGNGSPVTGYTITSTPDAVSKSVDADTTTATIGGLTNGTAYTFTVTATNAIGTSTASDPSNEVTPAGVPDTVTKPSATRGDKSATI